MAVTARSVIRDSFAAWETWEKDPSAGIPDILTGVELAYAASAAAPSTTPIPSAEPADTSFKLPKGAITRPGGMVYLPRKLGPHHDVAALRAARDEQIYVLLYGPPGTGKTALAEAAFEDLLTISGSGDTEVADFVGQFYQKPDGTFGWADGKLLEAMEQGRPLLIDEIALIDPKVMSVVYSAMDGRGEVNVTANPERGTVKAARGFYVIAAMNPDAPGARVSEALLSRFSLHAEVTTDFKLARSLGVPAKFVTCAKNLEQKRKEGVISSSPQLRECLAFKKISDTFGQDIALSNVVSTCPVHDRDVVASTLAAAFGVNVNELSLGIQA